jgi:hypothetical protein
MGAAVTRISAAAAQDQNLPPQIRQQAGAVAEASGNYMQNFLAARRTGTDIDSSQGHDEYPGDIGLPVQQPPPQAPPPQQAPQ